MTNAEMTNAEIKPVTIICPLTGLETLTENPLAFYAPSQNYSIHPIFNTPVQHIKKIIPQLVNQPGTDCNDEKKLLVLVILHRMGIIKHSPHFTQAAPIVIPSSRIYYVFKNITELFYTWLSLAPEKKVKFAKLSPRFVVNQGEVNSLDLTAIIPGIAETLSTVADSKQIYNKMSELLSYSPDRKAVIKEALASIKLPSMANKTKGSKHHYSQKYTEIFFELELNPEQENYISSILAANDDTLKTESPISISKAIKYIQQQKVRLDYIPDHLELLAELKNRLTVIQAELELNGLESLFKKETLTSVYEKQEFSIEIVDTSEDFAPKNNQSVAARIAEKESAKLARLKEIYAKAKAGK